MSVLHLNQSDFDQTLQQEGVLMVDFWASWCGPCKMIAPMIEELGAAYEGRATVAKIDVDESPAIAGQYGIMSIPTIVFFKDGAEINRKVGVQPKETYADLLDQLI